MAQMPRDVTIKVHADTTDATKALRKLHAQVGWMGVVIRYPRFMLALWAVVFIAFGFVLGFALGAS